MAGHPAPDLKELSDDHVSLIAAAVAFYGLLALFPAIGALISIWALALDPLRIEQQIGTLSGPRSSRSRRTRWRRTWAA